MARVTNSGSPHCAACGPVRKRSEPRNSPAADTETRSLTDAHWFLSGDQHMIASGDRRAAAAVLVVA